MSRSLPVAVMDRVASLVQRVTVGDLSGYGLRTPPRGAFTQVARDCSIPLIDTGVVKAIRRGAVEVVAAVETFDGAQVLLADGTRVRPDAVIAATGYRPALGALLERLEVLDADGQLVCGGPHTHPSAPELYFIGFKLPISGVLREISAEAKAIARAIALRRKGAAGGGVVPAPAARPQG